MQTNNLVKETRDVYGRRLNVKWISLGSIFRQVVLSRVNINYVHYMWPLSVLLCVLAAVVFLAEKYLGKISTVWITILTLSCVAIFGVYLMVTEIIEESIQVIDSFGIQLNSKARFSRENKIFFDFNSIEGVIINEGITMQRVIFYLALVVKENDCTKGEKTNNPKEETQLITVFSHSMPRRDVIKDIYHEIQPFLIPNNNDTPD